MWRSLPNGFLLSEFVPTDKPLLVQYLQEKSIADSTLTIPYPYTEADADAWIEHCSQQKKRIGSILQYAIRDGEAKLVGAIGFSEFKPGEVHKADLGYWVAKPFWGKGIATNAVKEMCRLAFDELGLIRLSATLFENNLASEKVLIKNGFVLEGTMKYHYHKNDTLFDGKLYARVIEPD